MFMCEHLEHRRLMTVSPGTDQVMDLDHYLDAVNTVLIRIPTKVTDGRVFEALQELPDIQQSRIRD